MDRIHSDPGEIYFKMRRTRGKIFHFDNLAAIDPNMQAIHSVWVK